MISIVMIKQYDIQCDKCGIFGESLMSDDVYNKSGAIKEWRKAEWVINSKRCTCRDCK